MSAGASTGSRLTVVASASTLDSSPFDGFVNRHVRLVKRLDREFQLSVVRLQHGPALLDLHPDLAHLDVRDLEWRDPRPHTRAERARSLFGNITRRGAGQDARGLVSIVASTTPRVLLTLGPWLDESYEPLYRRYPSIHLAEEDVFKMSFFAPPSLHGRLFRAVELMSRRAYRGQPRQVVVISDSEKSFARRRYLGIPSRTLPFTLDPAQWPAVDEVAAGHGVLVVGTLAQERNARGLVQLLEALDGDGYTPPEFVLVSDSGLHPDLVPYLDRPWVSHIASRVPMSGHYHRARVCVVPAREASGMKTTILQAWATGLPVATYAESAATFPPRFSGALVVAAGPVELAEQVRVLLDDPGRRGRLADRGLELIRSEFNDASNADELAAMLHGLVRRGLTQEGRGR